MSKLTLLTLCLAATSAMAQAPQWTVTLTPTLSPLPVGMCGAVHLTLLDPVTHDVPRNPQGYRVTMADFDLTVTGASAAGHHIDAMHFEACGCQGGAGGSTATITARYPAQSVPAAARVPGVSLLRTANVALGPPKGTSNPPACVLLASTGGATTPAVSGPSASSAPIALDTPAPRTPGARVPPRAADLPAAAPVAPTPSIVPVNPANAYTLVDSPDVTLIWEPVREAAFYVVFGPGFAPGGQRVENVVGSVLGAPSVVMTVNNIAPGEHEWLVASYYAGNVSTPAAEFTKAYGNVLPPAAPAPAPESAPTSTPAPAATPAPASGRYLVTITGVRAYQASMDDMLSRDGTGDEIYAAAYIRSYDRKTGRLENDFSIKTEPQGDTFHFTGQRIQAGTKTPTGGIQDGDMIPGPALIAMRSGPSRNMTFPMHVWEGALTDGAEALVISPSLWEQDVGDGFYRQWREYQASLNITLFSKQGVQDQISQQAFGAVIFGMSGNDTNTAGMSHGKLVVDTLLMMFGGAVPILSLTTTTADRPIGIQQNGRDTSVLPNHTIVLTREIIEKALASPALGPIPSPVANTPSGSGFGTVAAIARVGVIAPKPGIIVVDFQDSGMFGTAGLPERPAIYQMYIQVERVP